MLKFALVAAVLLVAVSASIVPQPPFEGVEQSEMKLLTPEEMTRFIEAHPDAVPMNREEVKTLDAEPNARQGQSRVLITYTLGSRVSGDSLKSTASGSWNFVYPTDVTATVSYPANGGNGAVITFMQVLANQSNELGRAYVTSGGIGKRYVTFVVEAKRTYWLDGNYMIFGHN